MRRIEVINAAEEVRQALEESGILAAVENGFERARTRVEKDRPEHIQSLFEALKQYTIRAQSFSSAGIKVAQILGLNELEESALWSKISEPEEGGRILYRLQRAIGFATEYLPKIVDLVRQEPLEAIAKAADDESSKYAGMDLISVIVLEEEERFSSPERLVTVLESIQMLYEASATMMGVPPAALSVVACDSGGDKSFDFLGLAKVVECVKEIILSLWDRVVFFREHQLLQRIELVAESLPVIQRIAELEQKKALGPEQAEKLKRNIIQGVQKFIECGAVIPEMQERAYYDPRLLMAPEPKLLTGPSAELSAQKDATEARSTESVDSDDLDLSSLNDDERSEFSRLLEKTRQKNDSDSKGSVEEPDE